MVSIMGGTVNDSPRINCMVKLFTEKLPIVCKVAVRQSEASVQHAALILHADQGTISLNLVSSTDQFYQLQWSMENIEEFKEGCGFSNCDNEVFVRNFLQAVEVAQVQFEIRNGQPVSASVLPLLNTRECKIRLKFVEEASFYEMLICICFKRKSADFLCTAARKGSQPKQDPGQERTETLPSAAGAGLPLPAPRRNQKGPAIGVILPSHKPLRYKKKRKKNRNSSHDGEKKAK